MTTFPKYSEMEFDNVQVRVLIPGLLYLHRNAVGEIKLVPKWKNLLLVSILLIVGTWVTFASVAYFHIKYRRNYEQASFLKTMILPLVWDSFEDERGQFYINSAFERTEQGDILSAINYFRAGLIRVPNHLKARLTLAEIYELVFERPNLAMSLLEDGLSYMNLADVSERYEYFEATLMCAWRNKFDEKVIKIISEFEKLYSLSLHETEDLRLAFILASSYRNHGDLESARKVIEDYQLNRTSSGLVLTAQMLWDEGLQQDALELLTQNLPNYEEQSFIFEKIIDFYSDLNDTDQVRLFSNLYRAAQPENYLSTIRYLTYFYEYEPEEHQAIDNRVQDYLFDFSENRLALKHLATVAARYGDTGTVDNVFSHYQRVGHQIDSLMIRFIRAESKVRSGHYSEALQDLETIENDPEVTLTQDHQSIIHSISAAAYFGLDDETYLRIHLDQLLESPEFKLARYFAISDFFIEVGAPDLALEVMERCMQTRATNPDVKQSFVEIHLKTNNTDELSERARDAMENRRLPSQLLKGTYRKLGSDRNAFVAGRDTILRAIEAQLDWDYLLSERDVL